LDLDQRERTEALKTRDDIAASVESASPQERFQNVQRKINGLSELAERPIADKQREQLEKIAKQCQEIIGSTKDWREVKERGFEALDEGIKQRFWALYNLCAAHGLFINTKGELESMLSDSGFPYTTNKKEWFETAISLVANLEVDVNKYPWKLLDEVHRHLTEGYSS
jgi:hypothetical protein